ncbi:MAG: hypothetical protein FJY73_08520 [Candidatus Eisenbacteria bacterium]|nr:hypothetical protein [Candidatus Eisenbacteria bacterium]
MNGTRTRIASRRGRAAALLLAGAAVLLVLAVVLLARVRAPGPVVGRKYLLSPIGPVGAADAFVWNRPNGAERFFLEVMDQDGMLLWSQATRDTMLPCPGGLGFSANRIYRWRVTYTFADGVSLPTNDETFQVLSPPNNPL